MDNAYRIGLGIILGLLLVGCTSPKNDTQYLQAQSIDIIEIPENFTNVLPFSDIYPIPPGPTVVETGIEVSSIPPTLLASEQEEDGPKS